MPVLPFARSTADHRSAGIFAGRYFGSRTALELGVGSDTASQEERITRFGTDPATGLPGFPRFPELASIELRIGTDTQIDDARLSVRHVGQLGDSTFALSATVRSSRSETQLQLPAPPDIFTPINSFNPPVSDIATIHPNEIHRIYRDYFESERERQLSLSGALFPTSALGVRLTYTESDHDTFGISDRVGLSANWFFVRNASVKIELVRASSARLYSGSDTDSPGLRLLGRFQESDFSLNSSAPIMAVASRTMATVDPGGARSANRRQVEPHPS